MPNRNCHLQAALLAILRDQHRDRKKALYAAFLDIHKAFDSINHDQLMQVLQSLGVHPPLLDIIRHLVQGNWVKLFGHLIPILQGTPQGGPLSPFLCLLFLEDLVADFEHQAGPLADLIQLPFEFHDRGVIRTALALLLYADDITALGDSIPHLQHAVDLLNAWAKKRGLRFAANKSIVMRLSRTRQDDCPTEELPAIVIDGETLKWDTSFRHLGHTIHEAPAQRYGRQKRKAPLDLQRLAGAVFSLLRVYKCLGRARGLNPNLVTIALHQVVHAVALYPTPVYDVSYEVVDKWVNFALKKLYRLPPTFPTVLLRHDFGLWPSEYYAHQRALLFIYRLIWRYWPGPGIRWLFEHNNYYDRLPPELDGIEFFIRFDRILDRYNMSWLHILVDYADDADLNADPAEGDDGTAISTNELEWQRLVNSKICKAITGWVHHHARRYELEHLTEVKIEDLLPTMPPWMTHGENLTRFALLARSNTPRLFGGINSLRLPCRMCCDIPGPEWLDRNERGLHILWCDHLPEQFRLRRDALAPRMNRERLLVPGLRPLSGHQFRLALINFSWTPTPTRERRSYNDQPHHRQSRTLTHDILKLVHEVMRYYISRFVLNPPVAALEPPEDSDLESV